MDLEVKSSQCGRIKISNEVGGRDEKAVKPLELRQHFGDLRRLPDAVTATAFTEESVNFIHEKNSVLLARFSKGFSNISFSASDVAIEKIRGLFHQQRSTETLSQPGGKGRFAGTRRPVETESGMGVMQQAVGEVVQVGIGVEKIGGINVRGNVGSRDDGYAFLSPQQVVDDGLESFVVFRWVSTSDTLNYLNGPGDDGRGKGFRRCKALLQVGG